MRKITTSEFDDAIKSGKVLVDFYADWCGPCKMLGPVLEEIDKEMDDVEIIKVNVDEENELAARFGVMSIPTTLLFKNGEQVAANTGYLPKPQMVDFISRG